jgi:hypothetical protein
MRGDGERQVLSVETPGVCRDFRFREKSEKTPGVFA